MAVAYTLKHPTRVTSLVLVSPAGLRVRARVRVRVRVRSRVRVRVRVPEGLELGLSTWRSCRKSVTTTTTTILLLLLLSTWRSCRKSVAAGPPGSTAASTTSTVAKCTCSCPGRGSTRVSSRPVRSAATCGLWSRAKSARTGFEPCVAYISAAVAVSLPLRVAEDLPRLLAREEHGDRVTRLPRRALRPAQALHRDGELKQLGRLAEVKISLRWWRRWRRRWSRRWWWSGGGGGGGGGGRTWPRERSFTSLTAAVCGQSCTCGSPVGLVCVSVSACSSTASVRVF